MHCVSEDPRSVMQSDSYLSSQTPGVPMSYPLAMNGMSGLSGYLGYLGAATTAADRAAALAQRKAAAAAKLAAAHTAHANAVSAAAAKRQATVAQHIQAQTTAKAARAAATAAHGAAVTATKSAAATKAAATKAAAAAKKAAGKPAASAASVAANMKILNDFVAGLKPVLANAMAKKRAPAKTVKGLFGFLGGLLGLRGSRGRMGCLVLDPAGSGQMIDDGTGPCPGSVAANPMGGPSQLMTIDPITGQPTAPQASGGMNPALMAMMMGGSGGGSGGGMNPAMLMMLMSQNGASSSMTQMLPLILEMGQSQGTAPKNCTPTSSRPACVAYYSSQQQQQQMMIIVMLIMQMLQQLQQVGTGGAAGGCPYGTMLDPAGSGQCVPMQGGMMPPGAAGCGPGFTVDPNSGQCISLAAATGGLPVGQGVAYPAGPIDPYTGQPVGSPYAPQVSAYPAADPYGNPMAPPSYDPSAYAGPPGAALPIPAAYGPPQAMGPMPYAPGGGTDPGAPSQFDPNMVNAYAGQPSLTDPYGDVAAIPEGFGGGGGGGGGDYIPQDMSVSQGPLVYMDYSTDVASLPDGSMDTGGGDGGGMMPAGIDPFSDVSAGAPIVTQMQQPVGTVQAGPPQGASPAPTNQQMAVAQLPAPSNMVNPGDGSQGPLATEDQGQIMAEFSDNSDFG